MDQEVQQAFNNAHPELQEQSVDEVKTQSEAAPEEVQYETRPTVDISPTIQVDNPNTLQNEPIADWYFADGVPGKGDKPEWFNDKTFKTLADQAKAQGELRKKLASFTGAPEEGYEVNLSPDFEGVQLDEEDPLLNQYAEFAKKMNMSQEGFDDLLNFYLKENIGFLENEENQQKTYWENEYAKLGPNAKEDLKLLHQWGEHNLPEELMTDFEDIFDNANKVKIFNLLMDKIVPTQLTHISHGTGLSRQHIREMMADKKYGYDLDYTRHVDAEANQLYGIKKNPIYG